MKNIIKVFNIGFLLLLIFIISCKTKPVNYITYYNKVNEIDSIFRFQRDTLTTIKKYRKLFRKYPPKNQERISEFETFVKIADIKNKKFGGQKSLFKLIPLVAPNWKYKKEEQDFFELYKKYGIDRIKIEQEVSNWKKGLNKKLIDSFSVAFVRDQEARGDNFNEYLISLDDRKNAELLLWTFKEFGFPSLQKIGLWGNNEVFMPFSSMFLHMTSEDKYVEIEKKVLEYVKSGDCPPRDYAGMVDRHLLQVKNEDVLYGHYISYNTVLDTLKVNKNRKNIGLPSIQHSEKIRKDFAKMK